MPAYDPGADFVNDVLIDPAAINTKFTNAIVVLAGLDTDNFDNDSVPLLSLSARENLIPLSFHLAPDMTPADPGVQGSGVLESVDYHFIGYLDAGDYVIVQAEVYIAQATLPADAEPWVQLAYLQDDDTYQLVGPQLSLRAGETTVVDHLNIPLPSARELYMAFYRPVAGKYYSAPRMTYYLRCRMVEV